MTYEVWKSIRTMKNPLIQAFVKLSPLICLHYPVVPKEPHPNHLLVLKIMLTARTVFGQPLMPLEGIAKVKEEGKYSGCKSEIDPDPE